MNKRECLYNSIYESAIRILTIISNFKRGVELQELVYFDYLLVHISELDCTLKSLHPLNPYHNVEAYSRRNLVNKSLILLSQKHLIDIKYDKEGLKYTSSSITSKFLKNFSSEYYNQLSKNSIIISNKFESSTMDDIEAFMNSLLKNVKDEYENEILFRKGHFDLYE